MNGKPASCYGCLWLDRIPAYSSAIGDLAENYFCSHPERMGDDVSFWIGPVAMPDKDCPMSGADAVELESDPFCDDFFRDVESTSVDPPAGLRPQETADGSIESSAVTEDSPELWQTCGNRVSVDEQSAEFAFVTLLTGPDPDLCTAPCSVAPGEALEVDLQGLEKLSASEVKKLISPTLPDAQLAALQAQELSLESPRKIALNAIRIELERRGPAICEQCGRDLQSFDAWVAAASADPLTGRIVAVAIAIGAADPEVFVVGKEGTEAEAMTFLFDRRGDRDVASFNFGRLWSMVCARAIRLDVPRSTNSVFPVSVRATGELNHVARAYGFEGAPYVATAATVYHHVEELAYRRLGQLAADQLEVERMVILAERTVS